MTINFDFLERRIKKEELSGVSASCRQIAPEEKVLHKITIKPQLVDFTLPFLHR